MGLQAVLIWLGVGIFAVVLLDALRRKRAAARKAEVDDYLDPEEAERRAQLARELPGLDPLFDEVEVAELEVFDDDPIPVLRNKHSGPAESEATEVAAQTTAVDAPSVTEQLYLLQPESAAAPAADSDSAAQEAAWEAMRRRFAMDPDFAAASRQAVAEQQTRLQFMQSSKDSLGSNLDDLVDLKLPASLAANAAVMQQDKPADPKLATLEEPAQVSASSLPEASQSASINTSFPANSELTPEDQANAEVAEQQLRQEFLSSLEKSAWGQAQIFLTININAPEGRPFLGSHVSQFMDIIGMKLSSSGFFHYVVEEKSGAHHLGYSLINMFAPGSFDAQGDFNTQGVVLVMPLPTTPRPMAVFERMLATARVMEKNWGAELQDEHRSNLTQQTIEHYRQTIKDFEYQARVNAIKARKNP